MAAATGVAGMSVCTSSVQAKETGAGINDLQPMTGDVVPITVQERQARIEKAQRLLNEQKMQALILRPALRWNISPALFGGRAKGQWLRLFRRGAIQNIFVQVLKKAVFVS